MARVLVGALLCLLLAAAPASGAPRDPKDWLRVMADGPLLEAGFTGRSAEYDLMVRSGVGGVRIGVPWAIMQPERDGPIDYSVVDIVLQQTAPRGIDVLPAVTSVPAWAARHPGDNNSPPDGTENYVAFVEALVRRYGPGGSFWVERPDLPATPIRQWQIWNEPNMGFAWSDQPFAADYVALLRASRQGIKALDPGAKVLLAGLVGRAWQGLAKIYAAGGRGLFDAVAIHPFTLKPDNTLLILRRVRRVMVANGDGSTPMELTELSWPAAKGEKLQFTNGFETTVSGQASRLAEVLPRLLELRRRYRIAAVYWLTWISQASPLVENDPFAFAGLRYVANGGAVRSRPVLKVYERYARR
jgi:hypothetical protein